MAEGDSCCVRAKAAAVAVLGVEGSVSGKNLALNPDVMSKPMLSVCIIVKPIHLYHQSF